jgi:hypothetical protein
MHHCWPLVCAGDPSGRGGDNVNPYRNVLARRGILEAALAAGAKPREYSNRPGITYPAPYTGGTATRWKAMDDSPRGKYRWIPSKPTDCNFYMPFGEAALKEEISRSDGNLWIANGEPGVWAYQAGGIQNVLATLYGEGQKVPGLAETLQRLGAKRVLYPVDKDGVGDKEAGLWRNALRDTSIEFRPLQLPEFVPEKGDVNDLWIALDFEGDLFQESLHELEALIIPQEQPRPARKAPPTSGIDSLQKEEAIEAIGRALGIESYKSNGWSRKNVCCPFHAEDHASSSFNRESGVLNCFAGCGSHSLAELCAHFGIDWQPRQPLQNTPKPTKIHQNVDSNEDPFAHLPDVKPRPRLNPAPTVSDVEPLPDYWLNDIPHGFLTLLLQYDPDGALPFVFIMRAIDTGLWDAQTPFTHRDLLNMRTKLEKIVTGVPSDDTIYRWFAPESPALKTICEIVYIHNSEFVTPKKATIKLGVTNSETHYILRSIPTILRLLLHRARLEGLRLCYPADEAGAVVPFDTTLLKAIGCNEPDALAAALEPVQRLVDQKLAEEQTRAARKLRRYMQRAHQYAANRDVIPFPEDMAIRTTADLRAALARGLQNAGLLDNPTKGDWMWELGINSKNGVDKVFEKAGIHQREQHKAFVITPEKNVGQQLRGHGKQHRAKVLHLELMDSEGHIVGTRLYQSDQQAHSLVCDHAMTGGMVQAVYQLPNEYSLRELPPRKPKAPRVKTEVPPVQRIPVTRKPRVQYYPGEIDPAWLREQQVNLLYALGWAKREGNQTVYINPKTDQKAPDNASIVELLALLSGRDVSEIDGPKMAEAFRVRIRPNIRPPGVGWRLAPIPRQSPLNQSSYSQADTHFDELLRSGQPLNPFSKKAVAHVSA